MYDRGPVNRKNLAITLGIIFGFFGSGVIAVVLMALDSKVRENNTEWLGFVLGPSVLILLGGFAFMLKDILGQIIPDWWRWLHRKDEAK